MVNFAPIDDFKQELFMELKAKLVQLFPLQTGQGKNGTWKKQDFLVETEGQYPKKVLFSIWGDKINESVLQIGNMLNISFDVESREYNSRWYTDLKAWKVESAGANNPPQGGANNGGSEWSPNDKIGIQDAPFMDDLPDGLPF